MIAHITFFNPSDFHWHDIVSFAVFNLLAYIWWRFRQLLQITWAFATRNNCNFGQRNLFWILICFVEFLKPTYIGWITEHPHFHKKVQGTWRWSQDIYHFLIPHLGNSQLCVCKKGVRAAWVRGLRGWLGCARGGRQWLFHDHFNNVNILGTGVGRSRWIYAFRPLVGAALKGTRGAIYWTPPGKARNNERRALCVGAELSPRDTFSSARVSKALNKMQLPLVPPEFSSLRMSFWLWDGMETATFLHRQRRFLPRRL